MTPGSSEDPSDNDELPLRGLTPRRYILPLIDTTDLDNIPVGIDLLKGHDNDEALHGPATAVVVQKQRNQVVIHVTPKLLHTEWLELPQINPKYNGRNYRYIYGISGPSTFLNAPVALQVSIILNIGTLK